MKTKNSSLLNQNKRIIMIALGVGIILLLLRLVMQFNDGMDWSVADFALAGMLLFGTGLAFELIARKTSVTMYRAALALTLGTALFLVWSNLAVGIIGSEDNPANLMYYGVIAVGIIGALTARFQPDEMARAAFTTALAQVLVTAIALITVKDVPVIMTLLINGFFVVLWIASAFLFSRSKEILNQRRA